MAGKYNAAARPSRASEIRVSSAVEPPGITETDKFLFTYLGHRSPVIPLGRHFRPYLADTARGRQARALTDSDGSPPMCTVQDA
jgi:hypothetical protein